MGKDVKGIMVEYEDGTTKRIEKGCCVDLAEADEHICIHMLHTRAEDMLRLAYGFLMTVEKMGMTDALYSYASGDYLLKEDEEEIEE